MSAPPRRAPGDVLVHLRRARDHADRHHTEPLDLAALAAVAGLSKYHFQRLFTITYGLSPAAYLSRRRVERAQDLLRPTNLTVTEVCHAVGCPGSFSTRFRELVAETPSEFQQRWAAAGAPRIPGCVVFMWGLAEGSASREKPGPGAGSSPGHMITNVSIASVFVKDIDASKAFYLDVLGFVENADITLGDGYRWCAVNHPDHPELMVSLAIPGPPHSPEMIAAINRALDGGTMHGLGMDVDDCRTTCAELKAKGVTFVQEPEERPYGVEAVARDNSGNWMVLVEPRPYTAADFS